MHKKARRSGPGIGTILAVGIEVVPFLRLVRLAVVVAPFRVARLRDRVRVVGRIVVVDVIVHYIVVQHFRFLVDDGESIGRPRSPVKCEFYPLHT